MNNNINHPAVFAKGFIQVFFIVINTYMVSCGSLFGVFITSFGTSLIWSMNVKSIAAGNYVTRLVYASGAAIGSVAGFASGALIIQVLDLVFNF